MTDAKDVAVRPANPGKCVVAALQTCQSSPSPAIQQLIVYKIQYTASVAFTRARLNLGLVYRVAYIWQASQELQKSKHTWTLGSKTSSRASKSMLSQLEAAQCQMIQPNKSSRSDGPAAVSYSCQCRKSAMQSQDSVYMSHSFAVYLLVQPVWMLDPRDRIGDALHGSRDSYDLLDGTP